MTLHEIFESNASIGGLSANHDNRVKVGVVGNDIGDSRIERCRNKKRCRPAVTQDAVINRRRQQRVQRHRHDTRLQRTPEKLRILNGVEAQHGRP